MINKIKSPSFIRYEANNEFRLGGYVAANPLTLNDKHTDMPHTYIKLQIGSGSNYKSWLVKHNEITKIWVQVPIQTSISNKLIKELSLPKNINTTQSFKPYIIKFFNSFAIIFKSYLSTHHI